MTQVIAKPQLGFKEAVTLASSRLTDLNGRSRRSEFWWFMLVFVIANFIIQKVLELFLPPLAVTVIDVLLMSVAYAATVRRLQDTGRSKWWVIVSWVASAVYSIYVAQSGLIEITQSVNPDTEAIIQIFSNPILIISSIVSLISGLAVIIFCILDGKPEPNKFGPSPKYVPADGQ